MNQPPKNAIQFEKRSVIPTTMAKMQAFHADPAALRKLTPPPIFVQVQRDDRTSNTDGDLEFTLWFGFIPLRWHVQHEPGPTITSFADRMLSGPVEYWRHEHVFTEQPNGIELTDRLVIAYPSGIQGLITRLMFGRLPLQLLFTYRHWQTRRAIS